MKNTTIAQTLKIPNLILCKTKHRSTDRCTQIRKSRQKYTKHYYSETGEKIMVISDLKAMTRNEAVIAAGLGILKQAFG